MALGLWAAMPSLSAASGQSLARPHRAQAQARRALVVAPRRERDRLVVATPTKVLPLQQRMIPELRIRHLAMVARPTRSPLCQQGTTPSRQRRRLPTAARLTSHLLLPQRVIPSPRTLPPPTAAVMKATVKRQIERRRVPRPPRAEVAGRPAVATPAQGTKGGEPFQVGATFAVPLLLQREMLPRMSTVSNSNDSASPPFCVTNRKERTARSERKSSALA